jgi:hypothetical protein
VDGSYPYPNASIGQIGFDVATSRVWTPADPDNARDVMGYCSPKWISDYTYRAIFTVLREATQFQSVATRADGLLVRVDLSPAGPPVIQPAYALSNVAIDSSQPGDHVVQVLGSDGGVLVEQSVAVLEASANDRVGRPNQNALPASSAAQDADADVIRSIQAILPRPPATPASIRLVRAGVVLAERPLTPASGTPSIVADAQSGAGTVLRWHPTDRPALVRMTTDEGITWETLAIDVVGGELQIDTAAVAVAASSVRFDVILADSAP